MKSLFSILIISTLLTQALAQDSKEKIMEGRATEMIRVIGLNDKDQWRKFIKENFTEAFINKTLKQKVVNSDNDGSSTEHINEADYLEAKVAMFERLHDDFGDSKMTSLKTTSEKVEMVLDAPQLKGTFTLKFETEKPYLINGLGIEAGN